MRHSYRCLRRLIIVVKSCKVSKRLWLNGPGDYLRSWPPTTSSVSACFFIFDMNIPSIAATDMLARHSTS